MKGVGSKAIEIILAARARAGRSPTSPTSPTASAASRSTGACSSAWSSAAPSTRSASRARPCSRRSRAARRRTSTVCMQWASTRRRVGGPDHALRARQRAAAAAAARTSPSGRTSSASPPRRRPSASTSPVIRSISSSADLRRAHRRCRSPSSASRVRPRARKVKVGGVVHTLKLKNNKKGDRYATFNLEDKSGTIEVIVWPETYRKLRGADRLATSRSASAARSRSARSAARSSPTRSTSLAAVRQQAVREIQLRLDEAALTAERAEALARMLAAHPGNCTATIQVLADAYVASVRLPRFRVAASERLVDAVEQLFGAGSRFCSEPRAGHAVPRRRRCARVPELAADQRRARGAGGARRGRRARACRAACQARARRRARDQPDDRRGPCAALLRCGAGARRHSAVTRIGGGVRRDARLSRAAKISGRMFPPRSRRRWRACAPPASAWSSSRTPTAGCGRRSTASGSHGWSTTSSTHRGRVREARSWDLPCRAGARGDRARAGGARRRPLPRRRRRGARAGIRAVLLDAANLYADHDCPRVPTLAALADLVEAGDPRPFGP